MNSKVTGRVLANRKSRVSASKRPPILPERFQLLVDCRDEADQRALYDELARRGVRCRVWVA